MKTNVVAFGLCIVVVLCLMIHVSVTKRTSIENEVYDSLEQAIDQSLEVINTKPYQVVSDEELVAEFNKALLLNAASDSEVSVKVYGVDYKQGYIDVEVSGKFVYGNGKEGVVKCRKSGMCEVKIEKY
jgi:hypothetical protein